MPKTEETARRSTWMRLETLCDCLEIDEAGVQRGLEAGQIERLHRAGQLLYRVRATAVEASDTANPSDRDKSWREALAAFKSRRHGRFLSRKRSVVTGTPDDDEPLTEGAEFATSTTEPELRTWSRFPGYFSPDFNPEETPA